MIERSADGKKWQVDAHPYRAELHLDNRRVPISRLMLKLGLHRFNNVGPLDDRLLETTRVGIKLKQHSGAPCEPVVSHGRRVSAGDVVGRPPESDGAPALGAPVHASIDGTVTAINDGVVWIEKS